MVQQLNNFRLSPQQKHLWSLQQQAGGIARSCCTITIAGKLHETALERALHALVSAHEILRTSYRSVAGMKVPVQYVLEESPVTWKKIDLSAASKKGQQGEIERLLQAEIKDETHFSADFHAPLHIFLFALSPLEHVLLLSVPGLSMDSRAWRWLLKEIASGYTANLNGSGGNHAADEVVQYLQYSEWQHELLENEDAAQGSEFWAKQEPATLAEYLLPGEVRASTTGSSERHTYALELPPGLAQDLSSTVERCDVSAQAFLLGCWQMLIWRLTGERQIVVRTVFHGRKYAELQQTLGACAKNLPVSVHFALNTPFRTIAERVQHALNEADAWQEFYQEPSGDGTMGIQVPAFEYDELPEQYAVEGFSLAFARQCVVSDHFKLKLQCLYDQEELTIATSYDPACFSPTAIQRLAGQFLTLLREVLRNPEVLVNEVPILSEEEWQLLLFKRNATQTLYPREMCVHHLFENQVAADPEATAVVYEGQSLSYAQLNARANQLAHYLQTLGVGPDVMVAICLERSLEMVVSLWGVLKAGGAYVPLDPAYPGSRIAFILEDTAAQVVITSQQIAATLPAFSAQQVCLDRDWPLIAHESQENPESAVLSEHIVYAIYTSGSTGTPKGIMIPHRGLVNYLSWCTDAYNVKEGHGTLVHSPLGFDLTVTSLLSPLVVGQKAVLVSEAQPIEGLVSALRSGEDYSLVKITPAHLEVLNELLTPAEASGRTRAFVIGGEALYGEKLHFWREFAPATRLINEYGPTETVVGCCVYDVPASDELTGPVVIGDPIANMQIYILDASLQPVPVGISGELYIGGEGLARGYIRRPDLTAASFIPHPFSAKPGERIYRTGDLACYREDGKIEYLGRLDTQVKLRGYRIELGEIEAVLAQHSGLQEVVVLAREDVPGDKRLVAYATPHKTHSSVVRQHLRLEREGLLAGYSQYELPNRLCIIQHSTSETQLIYKEIYEEQVYVQHGIVLPDRACIFDVGANIGLFSLFASQHCQDPVIYSFEPNPSVFDILRLNMALYSTQARLFPYGIADQSGSAEFTYYPHCSVISGFYPDRDEERLAVKTYLQQQLLGTNETLPDAALDELLEERLNTQQYTCPLKTISEIMREEAITWIDLLKVDVEKSELQVLTGIEEQDWEKIGQLVVEVYDSEERLTRVTQLLEGHGYMLTVVEDDLLQGSGFYNVYAIRPEYQARHAGHSLEVRGETGWYHPQRLREDVFAALKTRLPEYMVPSDLVLLDALPLTSSGKVDRRVLPRPDHSLQEAHRPFVAPTGLVEEKLERLFSDVLALERVSTEANFFDLGGHSMLATQLVSRIRSTLRVEIPLSALFEFPTVAALARYIETLSGEQGAAFPVLQAVARTKELEIPLSFSQQRLWFLAQLDPESAVYTIPVAIRLQGELHRQALERSLETMIQRHEILRTTFEVLHEKPVQVIHEPTAYHLECLDLREYIAGEDEAIVYQLIREEAQRPFDLVSGPLLRVKLLATREQEHVLVITMHHLITDGWSSSIFVRELTACYQAFVAGQEPALVDMDLQYADFALWQRGWLDSPALEQQLTYWRTRLDGLEPLRLPTDHPRLPYQTFKGARQSLLLSPELGATLKSLCLQEDVTPFMALLAIFQLLLYRYTQQGDIAVGTPIANRNRAEIENVIGFFVNTLVMRARLRGTMTYRELLHQVRDVALGAYVHQDLPFEKLVEVLQPERDASFSPLFQTMFIFQNNPMPDDEFVGLKITPFDIESTVAKFDLSLAVADTSSGLRCTLEYNTDLFEHDTITRMLGHWQNLVQAIVQDPRQRLFELALFDAAEWKKLVETWSVTEPAPAEHYCFHHIIEQQVARTPDDIALVFGQETLTYREMNERANQLAHYLRRHNVGPEVLVGLCMDRSLEMIVGLLGIMKAGGAYVPLDPLYPQQRLAAMIEDSRLALVVSQSHLAAFLSAYPVQVIALDGLREELAQEHNENPAIELDSRNPAYVIYTSGSTGTPKGSLVPHHGLYNFARYQQDILNVNSTDRVLQFVSLNFDASLGEIILALGCGGQLHLASREQLYVGQPLIHTVRERGITVIMLAPSALAVLPAEAFDTVRGILVNGEACTQEIVKNWARGRRFVNGYGPSENTIAATMSVCDADDPRPPTIGRALHGVQTYILDAYMQPVPPGVPGELYLGGVSLGRGYHDRADLTAERFVPHPFSQQGGERLYKTGDLVRYRSDGEIEFLGRLDHQVKLRGMRLELGEIEEVVSRHPLVQECAVVLHQESPVEKQLIAYLTTKQASLTPKGLRDYVRDILPGYMIPAHFVILDAMPLNPNGKVDRRVLASLEIGPEVHGSALDVPRTPVEELVVSALAELLNNPGMGIHENFFEVGGHSLLAAQLASRLRSVLHVELPLRALFEAPTAAGLAQRIEALLRSGHEYAAAPLQPVSRAGSLPLSFAQQRLWLIDQLETGKSAYNIFQSIRLQGMLNDQALEQSLQEVIRRHEILRTIFETRDDVPVQVIQDTCAFNLARVDMRSDQAREARALQMVNDFAHQPFDLSCGPLLRGILVRLEDQEYLLSLTIHHIVADGWSLGVLFREVATLYEAFSAGKPSPLPPLTIQYADYAVWQRQWLQGPALQAHLDFWKGQLRGARALEFPGDHPRPAVRSSRGARYELTLPPSVRDGLHALSRQEGVTLFMTLLAAFEILLYRSTGQDDLVVGTDIANRSELETESLIGFFINLLVLRVSLSEKSGFRRFLQQVKDVVLESYSHQNVPFDMLVEQLRLERKANRTPLVNVLFVLQNIPLFRSSAPGLTLTSLTSEVTSAKFDLAVFLTETSEGLRVGVNYSTDLFEEQTIATMFEHFSVLLQSILERPDVSIDLLEMDSEDEKARLNQKKGERQEKHRSKLQATRVQGIDL